MDRHICRAKDINTGEWVYGYYICVPNKYDHDLAHLIIEQKCEYSGCGEFWWMDTHEVDPETVCRCTGMTEFVMTDKSVNSPIFEGDIVEVWSRRRPVGENITLYRDNTTSKYDVKLKVRAVVYFKNGQWCLDYDNAYNNAICELKGNEQNERIVQASPNLYDFGIRTKDLDWFREHNQHYKWHDIVRIGNKFDNTELMEKTNE